MKWIFCEKLRTIYMYVCWNGRRDGFYDPFELRDPRLDILSKVHCRTYLYLSTYMYLDYTNKSDRLWRALLIFSIPAVIGTSWLSVDAVVKQVIRECVKNMGGTHSWVVWTWSTLHFRDISLLFWPLSDPLVWLQRHHC